VTKGLSERYRVASDRGFKLAGVDPTDTGGDGLTKATAAPLLAAGIEHLIELQGRLYAEHQWALLVILQGMDTSGKDGAVKHVMSGVNPLGCTAHSFQAPTRHELDHGYLWRSQVVLPRRGHIGISTDPITRTFSPSGFVRRRLQKRTCRRSW
jgi:polyphosphate kinase 2 (PPK2 family)